MRQRDEAKERRILAGALGVIERQGLAGFSMEAVAKAAGVAIGTLYIYFQNKEALLNALYLETKRDFARAVFEGSDPSEPIRPAFERMCIAFMRHVTEHRAEIVLSAQLRNSPYLFEQTKEATSKSAAPLLSLLERAKAEGLLKDLPSPLMLTFLQGALVELSAFVASEPQRVRAQRHAEIARLCWDALKA